MNESIRDGVLSSIDLIDESVDESILAVFCSIIQEYEKISVMMDNIENDSIYQEGQIWDTATGKGKIENGFIKLIAFIPRLFQGMINAITSLFKKTNEKDVEENTKLTKQAIAKLDSTQLAAASEQVSQATEDNLGFDPNKKEFVLKRGLKHLRNIIFISLSFPDLFKRFIVRLKGGDSQYDAMAKELMDVLKKKKPIDSESFYVSIDTLHQLYNDGYKASMGVRGLSSELSMLLEKKMREDFENGKNVEKQASAKKLLDEISNSSKHIMSLTMGLKIISKALYVFGGSAYRKFRKGTIDEEDVELSTDSQEKRELKNKLKSLKEQYKTITADKQRKDKKREEILNLEDKIKEMQQKIDSMDEDVKKAANLDERGDILWNQKDANGKKRHGIAWSKKNKDTREDLTGLKGMSKESRKMKENLDSEVPDII